MLKVDSVDWSYRGSAAGGFNHIWHLSILLFEVLQVINMQKKKNSVEWEHKRCALGTIISMFFMFSYGPTYYKESIRLLRGLRGQIINFKEVH